MSILEDIFDDFLRFFIPDADEVFDMQRGFVFLDKELEQLFPPEGNAYDNRNVDKLVQVYTQAGEEQWVLVHVEVQGHYDASFAERIFLYFARIYDKYRRPITAFAILTDAGKSYRPSGFQKSLLGTSLNYQFNSYKVLDQLADELAISENPFVAIVLVVQTALQKKRVDEQVLLDLKIILAKALLAKSFSKAKIRQLLNFLRYYVRFDKTENTTKFDQEIDRLTNRQQTIGLEEFLLNRAVQTGLKQGIEKEREERNQLFVTNLIQQTPFGDQQIAGLTDVSVEFVQQVRRELA